MADQNFAIRADDENNAEVWWDSLRERNASFAKQLAKGVVVVPESVLAGLQSLPGFEDPDAPTYAPHPISWVSEHQEGWAELVGGPHCYEGSL